MGTTIYPTVPVAQPAAEPWPIDDEFSIRADEMFARQLDNEFSVGVRGLLHDPETGIAAQNGEAALEAIAGALPALNGQGERRSWDPAETDTRVRAGLSDLYAGAVEAAIGQDDLDGASSLYAAVVI